MLNEAPSGPAGVRPDGTLDGAGRPPHPLIAILIGLVCGLLATTRVGYGLLDQPAPWRSDLLRAEHRGWVALVVDGALQRTAGSGIDQRWSQIAADRGLRCPEMRRLMLQELNRGAVDHILEMSKKEPPLAVILPLDIAFPGRKEAAGVGRRPRGPNEGKPIVEGPYLPQEDTELLVRELRDSAKAAFALLDIAPPGAHQPAWSEAQRADALQLLANDERFLFRPEHDDDAEQALAAAIAEWLCVPL